MTARQHQSCWTVVALACLGTILLLSCNGDGVGLDENGDPLMPTDMLPEPDTVATIVSAKDNTLYESLPGDLSNGAGDYFFAGRTARGSLRRGLVAFDVDGNVPAGATITAITLTLHLSQTPAQGGQEIAALHRVMADWGEGTSDADFEEGGGIAATTGDATWIHTFFDTQTWASAGGDFSTTISASQTVDAVGSYSWSGVQMIADAQMWLDTPTTNFGWILIINEAMDASAKRFDTHENPNNSFRPTLRIEFTPLP